MFYFHSEVLLVMPNKSYPFFDVCQASFCQLSSSKEYLIDGSIDDHHVVVFDSILTIDLDSAEMAVRNQLYEAVDLVETLLELRSTVPHTN